MDQHARDVRFVPKADIGTQPLNVRFRVARNRKKRTPMSPTSSAATSKRRRKG